ncbi:hypothetical protein BC936DRAFT_148539 [Jimgerdemannia flammicorona]|uniref:Uncharacterized protein n=1 Tax=Jimgerdemannia flammicorona TaxID=994334 RepID=A0A433D309_9FUNG|nr:hypothetical protein BC936DRAFT_148539 [Jimgerdemannia flammicorona]
MFEIPNAEVYMQWVFNLVPELCDLSKYETLVDRLISYEIDTFNAEFDAILLKYLSHYMGGWCSERRTDIFYHAFCFGINAELRRRGYSVVSSSKRELGLVKMYAVPNSATTAAVLIIEIKLPLNKESLEMAANQGIDQIKWDQYISDKIQQIFIFSIAFQGNQSCVSVRICEPIK